MRFLQKNLMKKTDWKKVKEKQKIVTFNSCNADFFIL